MSNNRITRLLSLLFAGLDVWLCFSTAPHNVILRDIDTKSLEDAAGNVMLLQQTLQVSPMQGAHSGIGVLEEKPKKRTFESLLAADEDYMRHSDVFEPLLDEDHGHHYDVSGSVLSADEAHDRHYREPHLAPRKKKDTKAEVLLGETSKEQGSELDDEEKQLVSVFRRAAQQKQEQGMLQNLKDFVRTGRGHITFMSINAHNARGSSESIVSAPTTVKNAILVRTCNPRPGNAEMIAQWFSAVQNSTDISIHLSIDQASEYNPYDHATVETSEHNIGLLLKELGKSQVNLDAVHRYSAEDMYIQYPALQALKSGMRRRPLAWGYHTPAIDMFVQTLPRGLQTFEYLWVIEDDIGISGSIVEFTKRYSRNNSDLLVRKYDSYGYAWHHDRASPAFKKLVPDKSRMACPEQISRFSTKLLERLHKWMKAGAIDWSEAMPGSVCLIEKDMSCGKFESDDFGEPFTFDHMKTIFNRSVWQSIVSNDSALLHRPRLYHPVKLDPAYEYKYMIWNSTEYKNMMQRPTHDNSALVNVQKQRHRASQSLLVGGAESAHGHNE